MNQKSALVKPNLFIVGAPKCGTTALHYYLAQHPEIYMFNPSDSLEAFEGGKKELHFFGSDLDFKRPQLQEYLSYFSSVSHQKIVGESSVFYLYSQRASQEIKAFNGDAKIIIMLRNPVDTIYSWHSQLLFWGDENLTEFEAALNAEKSRKQGKNIPQKRDHPLECFFYRDIVRFYSQIKRYFEIFERKNIHIIIFDDFTKDTASVYQKTLCFLGCQADFEPDFKVINGNKNIRNLSLQKFLRRPPQFIRTLARTITPPTIRQNLRHSLQNYNTQNVPRLKMNQDLKKRLKAEFEPEVEQLSLLLNRDLTYWSKQEM